jgi:hypothetical protein
MGAGGTQYAYYHEEDESTFQLVDTSRSLRGAYGRGRFFRGRGAFGGRGGQVSMSQNVSLTSWMTLQGSVLLKHFTVVIYECL